MATILSDGQHTYQWDAENRLLSIAYPEQSGKLTAFAYDGLGRHTSIISTPTGGGSPVTQFYVWCGSELCQTRDVSNAVAHAYFAEGERQIGTSTTNAYYAPDQIGSVRRVFTAAASPSFDFGAYGTPLQSTAPVTYFGYAGMFYNADSGLNLTMFRPYDPSGGRWLSRGPMGENSDPMGNLHAYVGGNPVRVTDPLGLDNPGVGPYDPPGGRDCSANNTNGLPEPGLEPVCIECVLIPPLRALPNLLNAANALDSAAEHNYTFVFGTDADSALHAVGHLIDDGYDVNSVTDTVLNDAKISVNNGTLQPGITQVMLL